MVLHYLKKKENKEQIIATQQYKKILSESTSFLNNNKFFKVKDFKKSFEIVCIFLKLRIIKLHLK